jgi:hypothetical protein
MRILLGVSSNLLLGCWTNADVKKVIEITLKKIIRHWVFLSQQCKLTVLIETVQLRRDFIHTLLNFRLCFKRIFQTVLYTCTRKLNDCVFWNTKFTEFSHTTYVENFLLKVADMYRRRNVEICIFTVQYPVGWLCDWITDLVNVSCNYHVLLLPLLPCLSSSQEEPSKCVHYFMLERV